MTFALTQVEGVPAHALLERQDVAQAFAPIRTARGPDGLGPSHAADATRRRSRSRSTCRSRLPDGELALELGQQAFEVVRLDRDVGIDFHDTSGNGSSSASPALKARTIGPPLARAPPPPERHGSRDALRRARSPAKGSRRRNRRRRRSRRWAVPPAATRHAASRRRFSASSRAGVMIEYVSRTSSSQHRVLSRCPTRNQTFVARWKDGARS